MCSKFAQQQLLTARHASKPISSRSSQPKAALEMRKDLKHWCVSVGRRGVIVFVDQKVSFAVNVPKRCVRVPKDLEHQGVEVRVCVCACVRVCECVGVYVCV